MICSQLEKGNTDALCEYYPKLGWEQSVIYVLDDVEKYFVKAMWTLPYEPVFTRIVVDVFANRELRVLFYREIMAQESESNVACNDFQRVVRAFVEAMQVVLVGPKFWAIIRYYYALVDYVQATAEWMDFAKVDEADYVQAAVKIRDYLKLETQDKIQAFSKLKEVVDIFPEFADGIGRFLHFYADLEKERAEKQKKEMEELRIQIMKQVREMFGNGQKEAAIQIIAQLKTMFPEDLEVAALALEIRLCQCI